MIVGYEHNWFYKKDLEIFKQTQFSYVKINYITFSNILPICSTMGALEGGMEIHQRVVENGFVSNVVIVKALIGMYWKYERIHKDQELFNKMHDANMTSWNAMNWICRHLKNDPCSKVE